MNYLKRIFKRNTHNPLFKGLAGFGRSINRLYENRNHDIYSNGELTVIKKLSHFQPQVIIDGGANRGTYSLLVNKFNPNCKIYAFEPVQDTYLELQENAKGHNNVQPINKGLYSVNGAKEIYLFPSSTHSSLYDINGSTNKHTGKITIELIKGDSFVEDNNIDNIDFLKLDIEGAEYEAILGFENTFKSKRIKAVQFEYSYINISTKKLLLDYYVLLESYGYKVGKIFPKRVEFRDYKYKYEDFIGPNFIAVDQNEMILIKALSQKGFH